MEPARCVEPGFFPLDKELELLPGSLTPCQHDHLVHLATWMPFTRASQMLERLLGVQVSAATVRRLTEQAGARYEAAQTEESQQGPGQDKAGTEASAPVDKLVVSGDGAFVPLVHGAWAEVKMLAIGEVKEASASAQKRGQQVQVEQVSYFARLTTAQRFADLAQTEMCRRQVSSAKAIGAVSDGADWLQHFFDLHCPDAVRILDFPHAAQRLGSIATEAAQAGYPLPAEWVEKHRRQLKKEGPGPVLAELADMPASVLAIEKVQEHWGYLHKRVEMMQYPTYIAQGWPLGSGMVESANKLVMQARLKGSGMHWEAEHVNPMLALRTAVCNERWEEAWQAICATWVQQQTDRQKQGALPRLFSLAWTLAWLARQLRPAPPPPRKPLLPPDPPARLPGTSRPSPHHPWKRAVVACPKGSAKK
jgi:Uncharacterised protein family (UPF0236)